jgi:glycine C-acetyltransferase
VRDPSAFLATEQAELVARGLDWKLHALRGPSMPWCEVDGKRVLMLCSNNYLGLSNHPALKAAAQQAIADCGVGSGSVRPIAGNMAVHEELERRLARFKGAEASLTFSSGFATNAGLLPQLVGEGDLAISDELNHGSIIDGLRLSKAERAVYRHGDVADLERVLAEADRHRPAYRRLLVVTDGVFSMDGDIAPLDGIARAAGRVGAMVYVDDAHGEGVLGEGGRGIVSHFKLGRDQVQVEMGTFSKAFGVVGGHISGSRPLIDFAFNRARTWLLSGSQPPPVAAACLAAVDVLEREPQHVERLWAHTRRFKKALAELGFSTGKSATPITPIMVGDSHKARALSERLFAEGVFALPIVFPMVAKDQARIRTILNAALTDDDLDLAIAAFERAGRAVGLR